MTQSSSTCGTRLILVYNADSGLITALMHAVHKQVFPSSYPCSLCALTYGAVSMRSDWKRFWKSLDAQVVFHHRDDFTAAFPALGTGGEREVALPSILISEAGEEPRVLIANDELDAMADVNDLIERLGDRLAVPRQGADAVPSAA